MPRPLILVSDEIKNGVREQIQAGLHPRLDYLELARRLDANLLGYSDYRRGRMGAIVRRLENRASLDFGHAWAGIQQADGYSVLVSTSEKVGIPLSLLLRGRRRNKPHVMIGHFLLSPRKRWGLKLIGALHSIGRVVCLTRHEVRLVQNYFGLPLARLCLLHHHVDQVFFRPVTMARPAHILTVGVAERDYTTLMQAIRGLPVELKVAGASSWYARHPALQNNDMPPNATMLPWCCPPDFRQLYTEAHFIIVPLKPTFHFTAGTTTVLEAAAMEKAVVTTKTPGMVDYVIDGETGILVEPYDVDGMREAIQYLLDNPHEAKRMGRNGRQLVEREMNIDVYVEKLAQIIEQVMQET